MTRKLHSDTGRKFARMTNITTAFGEEEAGPQGTAIVEPTSHSSRDCGLSRTSETVQPVQTPLVLCISPAVYLVQESRSCTGQAERLVLPNIRIERRFDGVRQSLELGGRGLTMPPSATLDLSSIRSSAHTLQLFDHGYGTFLFGRQLSHRRC